MPHAFTRVAGTGKFQQRGTPGRRGIRNIPEDYVEMYRGVVNIEDCEYEFLFVWFNDPNDWDYHLNVECVGKRFNVRLAAEDEGGAEDLLANLREYCSGLTGSLELSDIENYVTSIITEALVTGSGATNPNAWHYYKL